MGELIIIAGLIWLFYKIFTGKKNKGGNKSKDQHSTAYTSHYWNLKSGIMRACWNDKTKVFNWNAWFAYDDELCELKACGIPEILSSIDNDLRNYGKSQIIWINSIIQAYFLGPSSDMNRGMREMKRSVYDTGIYLNLKSMFSYKNAEFVPELCPEKAAAYRDELGIFFGHNQEWVTTEKCREIIDLGDYICNHF